MSPRFPLHGLLPVLALLCTSVVSAQAPIYTFNGDGVDDRLGYSVRRAGDVNGDGIADVIVGAPLDDNNGAESGMARVLSGADGATLYTFDGDGAGDNFGWSVSGAGDVDGDGFADLIVGAPLDDNNGTDCGMARVLSGADGTTLYTFFGDSAGDNFGWAVSGAGDVNGDGYADLVVGAPLDDDNGADSGSARVFSGVDGSTLYTFLGDSAGDNFGWAVSAAGDSDADCYGDLAVGAPLDDNNGAESGMVRVLSGKTGLTLWSANGGNPADNFGWSVSSAGDANADGKADVIAGAPLADIRGTDSGMARILSGVDGSTLHTLRGDAPGDNLGWSVGGYGDVNGDGVADVITGSPMHDLGGSDAGRASVWSGATGLRLWVVNGSADQDHLGWSVDIAGDVNSDGFADLVVGAVLGDNNGAESGSALVFARKPFANLTSLTFLAPAASPGLFGNDNQQVGDVNNDGIGDFALGAVSDVGAQGVVRVYSGADLSILHTFVGGTNNIFFGPVVGRAGDIDGDGYDDILTGAQHYPVTVGNFEGRATLRSGQTGAIMHQWFGTQINAHMGAGMGGLGDIDGDNVGDVFIALLKQNTGAGVVRTYSGATGQMIYEVMGAQPGEWFGVRGATIGDLNGDGITEYVIGCPQSATAPAALQGYAVVLSGVDGSQIWRFNGLGFGDQFGWSVAGPGDVDGDGFGDIIVGGQGYDAPGRLNAGMARVFSGATGKVLYHHAGLVAGDGFGEAVNGAGDVNGDGYADYIVGAPGADPNGLTAAGQATLYSGQNGSVLRTFNGEVVLGLMGKAVGHIGDYNGDGYTDVSASSPQDSTAGAQSGATYLFDTNTKSNPGSFGTYGASCVGSNGKLPKMGFSGRPVLTKSFAIEVSGGPSTSLASLGIAASRQNIPLGFIGAPGCTFLALPVLSVNLATTVDGKASLQLNVPNDVAIVGASLYVQWVLSDPGANTLTFTFSDGGIITIGNP